MSKNLQLFTVSPAIPPALRFLETLAGNLWWCWNNDAIELFRRIDPTLWSETGHNPLTFLSHLPQALLEDLVSDEGYMAHYEQVQAHFRDEVPHPSACAGGDCIAYFSMEYGIHESIRLYSGGLGVLAGDHLKAASDQGLPLVGVGLMYRCGYFQQLLNEDGWQQEAYPENEINAMPLTRAVDPGGREIEIELPLPDGTVKAIVWQLQVGRIPLYLLDTNIPENTPDTRGITWQLYQADRGIRLRQELLLGIGGFWALRALGYEPAACHINEGHAAFMTLARISHLIRDKGLDFDVAEEIARRTNIFTTHTPVPAGNETFNADLVDPHLAALAQHLAVPSAKVLEWGHAGGTDRGTTLSMTVLGLRTAELANGVSKLHGRVARKMWSHLWPGFPMDEVPIQDVTNGVHAHSWLSAENAALYDRYLGPDWHEHPVPVTALNRLSKMPHEEIWRVHEISRARLIRTAREQGEKQYRIRNASKEQLANVKSVLSHDVLTIGFARRFASYKRATLLLKDLPRLEALLTNKDRPIQVIFAGKAHPADHHAKELIRQLVHFARQANVRNRVIFLEDYDIRIGRALVQGVDVWLNTPRRPQEASGTSGMKAAINGALHLSILDGWWDEGYSPNCGWAIGRREVYDNPEYQDSVEAQALYNLLENEVVPAFYDRPDGSIPTRWTAMMKASIRMAISYFTSARMIAEYNDRFYRPAVAAYASLLADGAAHARELVGQNERLRSLWPGLRIEDVTTDRDLSGLHVGDRFTVSAIVNLGKLTPGEVEVQVYHGPVSAGNQITESHAQKMTVAEERAGGKYRYSRTVTCDASGRYGFTVRAVPHGEEWRRAIPGYIAWANGGQ